MKTKEKAEELVDKYRIILIQSDTDAGEEILCTGIAKQCALIAVDEVILEQCKSSEKKDARYQDERLMYWQQVKEEIEKL